MTRLFEEIQYNIHELLLKLQRKDNILYSNISEIYNLDTFNFVDSILNLYKYEEYFTKSLEFNLSMKLFTYLSILSDVHGIKTIEEHFRKIRPNRASQVKAKISKVELNADIITSFHSPNSFKIYRFIS